MKMFLTLKINYVDSVSEQALSVKVSDVNKYT